MGRIGFWLAGLLLASCLAGRALAHGDGDDEPATFRSLSFGEEVTFFGIGPRGFLHSRELDILSQLMRCRRTGRDHRIHPRLARMLVNVGRHFRRPVVVVSGYRGRPLRGRTGSFHLRGMAADAYVYGLAPETLRDYAVERGVPGVGYYPNSGFVHLDVRPTRFWWVDYSGPGERERLRPDPTGTASHSPGEVSQSVETGRDVRAAL